MKAAVATSLSFLITYVLCILGNGNGFVIIQSQQQQSSSRTITPRTRVIENKSNQDVTTTTTTTIISARPQTIEAPTREKTDRKVGGGNKRKYHDNDDEDNDEDDWDYPDLEYAMDPNALRGDNDPFHILLMGSTFEKPKVTVSYVSNSLEFVLDMPIPEAIELSTFARDEGMSCLGTWPHEQCVQYGKQLQVRDIVCRVVPYCEGGQRGWQAKDGADAGSTGAGASGSN